MSLTHHKNTEGANKEKYFRLPNLDIKNTRKQGTLALVEQNNRKPSMFFQLAQIQHELKDPNKYLDKINKQEEKKYRKQSIQLPDIDDIDDIDDSFVGNYIRIKHDLKKLPPLRGFNRKYLEEEQNGGKKHRSPKRSTKKCSTRRKGAKALKCSIKRKSKKRSIKRKSKKRSTKRVSKKRSVKRVSKKRASKKHSTRKSAKALKRSTKRASKKRSRSRRTK